MTPQELYKQIKRLESDCCLRPGHEKWETIYAAIQHFVDEAIKAERVRIKTLADGERFLATAENGQQYVVVRVDELTQIIEGVEPFDAESEVKQ